MNIDFEVDDSVEISPDGKAIILRWAEVGEYDISLNTIGDHQALLYWVHHLSTKSWSGMTPSRIGLFISKVCTAKGWNLFGEVEPQ